MYRQKVPNSGWAAFDLRWRGKNSRGDETDVTSFPPLSDSGAPMSSSSSITENNRVNLKPFASVVRPYADPAAVGNGSGNKQSSNHVHGVNYGASSASGNKILQLKDAHSWADSNLIEDVLAAVNGDVGQASDLLKAMLPPDMLTGDSKTSDQFAAEMGKESSTVDRHLDRPHLLPLPTNLSSIPMEPELQELDDDYLKHRKDALKMLRAATRHSQAASNAFMRGDHAAAKELSLKAQDERAAAEKLNNKAAEEIFRLRNSNNDIWKVDMHGLHASEAVAILERHLHTMEFQPPGTSVASSDELAEFEAAYSESTTVEFATDKVVLRQPKQAILHVITGIGNHSKGQASLPVAVRGFLIENGYRFDELRPGVFAVRPKFRCR